MRGKRGVGKSQENKGQNTKEIQVTKRLGYIGEGISGKVNPVPGLEKFSGERGVCQPEGPCNNR